MLMVHPGPDFSVADVHRGWARALQALGHQVAEYNTNDRLSFYSQVVIQDWEKPPHEDGTPRYRPAMSPEHAKVAGMQGLYEQVYKTWPQVIIFVSGFYLRADMLAILASRGHKIVIIHTESPYQDEEQLMRAGYADLNILNDPSNLAAFEAAAPSVYVPHAYDPDIHFPNLGAGHGTDFCFVGTMYESRRSFFEQLDFGDAVPVFGGGGWDQPHMDGSPLLRYLGHPREECVDNLDTALSYRATRSSLNFYRREGEDRHQGEGWAIGPREVELAACGVPFLRDPRPESDEVFPFLPSFDGPGDASEKLAWLLADEDRRVMLARQAQRAIAPRTFRASAARMLQELDRLAG